MKLSIIIVTRNRADMLKHCLDSLARQTKKPDEVLVVDNDSNDNTKEMVNNFKKKLPVKYIFEPKVGIPIARNTGIKNAKYDIIAFIDDDCIAEENWINNLLCAHKKNPDILIIQGKTYETSKNGVISGSIQYLLENCNPLPLDTKNLSFKRRLLGSLGYLFDEKFRVCEDVELGVRLQQKGYKVFYSKNIIIYHNQEVCFPTFFKQQFIHGKYAYLLKYKYKKNKKGLPTDLHNVCLMIGSLLIMPCVHMFRGIKVIGVVRSIKYFPFIFSQKLSKYLGFLFGRIKFGKKRV